MIQLNRWLKHVMSWVVMLLAASTLIPVDTSTAFRTIMLDVDEVTQPDVATLPNGQTLVFSLLGHLFTVPVRGGMATQLTFGFAYDSEPVVSPDGGRLAFISDRDGSSGNVFVLDLATRKWTQVSHEVQAGSPRWSPDGKKIAYFRLLQSEELPGEAGFGSPQLVELKTVSSGGGPAVIVVPPSAIQAFFYLPDGRLGWTIPEPGSSVGMYGTPRKMHIEAREADGRTVLLGTIPENLEHPVLSSDGKGVYYSTEDKIRFSRFAGSADSVVSAAVDLAQLTDGVAQLTVSGNGSALFFGDRGKLWSIKLPDGQPKQVTFQASAKLEARKPTEPKWTPPAPGPAIPRAIICPQLSPDGKLLVFMAAGFLYEQRLDGQPARRLFEGCAFERDPSFSPDGKWLAYTVSQNGQRELRIYDFESRQSRSLYTVGGASWASLPTWSPDGTQVVFQRSDGLSDPYRIIRINLADGKVEELARTRSSWTTRPHFSSDGRALYFTDRTGKYAALCRLTLTAGAKPEALTSLTRHVSDGQVSPDGKWLAFRRNTEVWVAPLGPLPIHDSQLRLITSDCSRSFTFTPDSSALLYSGGNRVWRQPLAGGGRVAIPIRLTLERKPSTPLLLRRVRVLDFSAGRFSGETSLLIRDGKIEWIGSESEHEMPNDAVVLECGSRYAIPGLIDDHVHSAWANQMASEDAFIAFGNTSVRDVGASLDLLHALRDRGETTDLPVPRYWYSGEILEGAMPLWGDAFLQIADEKDARLAVRKWKEWGSDLIKVYLTVPWHLQNVIADEAQKQGLPLSGHAISFEETVRHALQGYASVEHTTGVMHADGRKLLAATGTRWVGTLTCEGGSEIFMREDPPVHMASDLVRRFVPPDKIKAALKGGRLSYYPKEYWPVSMKSAFSRIFPAYREGVKVRAGTDTTMPEVFFGLSLHWELEFFRMAGLSPLEALRLGTMESAETVGAAASLGTLAPGKLADVVILDADPLEEIRNTIQIWRVIKDGRLFDPKTIRSAGSAGPRDSSRQNPAGAHPAADFPEG